MKSIVFVFTVLICLSVSCGNDKAWEETLKINTLEAYEKYIAENPKGKYIGDAENYIQKIKQEIKQEQSFWDSIVYIGTLEAYNSYLEKYPDGMFNKMADSAVYRYKMSAQNEDEAWKLAQSQNTYFAYKDYLNNYEHYAEEANEKAKQKFKELINKKYTDINDFFSTAKPGSKIPKDSIYGYFSDIECNFMNKIIKGGVYPSSIKTPEYDFTYALDLISEFYQAYKTNQFDEYEIINTDTQPVVYFTFDFENDLAAHFMMTLRFREEKGHMKIFDFYISVYEPGC
jgi:hypothetical protein